MAMSHPRAIALATTLGMMGLVPAAQPAPVDTGWVTFEMRTDQGNTYVYPRHADGSLSYAFSGNCQFNALVLADTSFHDMLLTAKEQKLRVSLGYDDTEGPLCRLAYVKLEWAD